MKYVSLYTDGKGETHFKNVDKIVFFQIPSGWFGDWHPAPKTQFFCCLKGDVELTTSDGDVQRFKAGDVFLLEDTSGKGHTTRVIGEAAFEAAVVQLSKKLNSEVRH